MRISSILSISVFVLIGLALGGLALELLYGFQILNKIADFSLILTLAAVLLYVYYTYLIAREAWVPSASFVLKPYPNKPYHFAFIIKNYSKVSLQCWCKLNVTVNGQGVPSSGFYGGEHSFDFQPFGGGNGHFDIQDLLKPAGYNVQQMKQAASPNNVKDQLYLNIEFWYNPVGSKLKTENPRQPHYFDFTNDVMVADF